MKHYYFCCLITILFSSSVLLAQNDNLIGHWDFHQFQTTEKLDTETLNALDEIFKDVQFEFRSDATYTSQLMKRTDKGTWKVQNDEIITQASNGIGEKIKFIQTHKDTLKLELEVNQYLVLKRGLLNDKQTVVEPAKSKFTPVVADRNMLLKKWYMVKKIGPGKSQTQIDMTAALLEGSYFEFKKDGKYNIEMLGIKEKGTWELNESRTEIIQLKSDDTTTTWKIVKLTETELIMAQGESEDQLILSANKPK